MDPSGIVPLATAAVLALVGFALTKMARGGRYPRLLAPDPSRPDALRDRLRYYLANLAAVAVGVLAGTLLWLVPPAAEPGALWRVSTYDDVGGRMLGPLFFGLGAGGLVVPSLAMRWVAPGPLQHILWRSAKRQFCSGLDLRPALLWLSALVAAAAIGLHFAIRLEHTTMDHDGIRWRDWPWQSEVTRPWSDVADLRIVRTFTATTGAVRVHPHLSIEFVGGQTLRVGRRDAHPEQFWVDAAELASRRSGVVVRHVERD